MGGRAPNFFTVDPAGVRDITPDVFGGDGRMRILSADWWSTTTREERILFGHRNAVYGFPTIELVDYLRAVIGDRKAIEIGAGNGILANALGIQGTDNYQQRIPRYRNAYAAAGQPVIAYGKNVVNMAAYDAIRYYRPQVVVASWVTHRFNPDRPEDGGNEIGVDEEDVLAHCEKYVFVGNRDVHRGKTIWDRRHNIVYPRFVYSRAIDGSKNFVCVWTGGRSRDAT